jgi:circadian clock protein KaiC
MNPTENEIPKCLTGIEGLDEILCGGLPRDRVYLIRGDPGVGKTTLSLQFLREGMRHGESVLYITLSETKQEMDAVAQSHGWDLSGLNVFELSAIQERLQGRTESTFFHPSEVELNRTTQVLLDEIERVKPSRLVFDSLSEMRMLAETPLRYRRQMLQLKQYLSGRHCTVLLLDDRTEAGHDLQIESIAHGVIHVLKTSPAFGVARRQLNVVKVRGIKYREGFHDLVLNRGGMVVFPRLVAAEHHVSFKRESVSSGVSELDVLLGGGLDRGTSTMFMGPAGAGKSTLTTKFMLGAAERGERVLAFLFDETISTMMGRARALGMSLDSHRERGTCVLQQVDPAEIAPGELTHRIKEGVMKDNVRMVIIDSINGYLNAMPEERFMSLQLHELLAFLNQQGVVTIMVLAQQGVVGPMQSAVDLTYLSDTVVLLRFYEHHGEVKQAVSVLKKRSGNHERTIREFRTVTKDGVFVGKPLHDMHGVLTGVPRYGLPPAPAGSTLG